MVALIRVNAGRSSVTTRAPGALADRDRQPPVLHRGVEGLLEGAGQPVDLVDEEHAARLERGEVAGDVALALERGASGRDEVRLEPLATIWASEVLPSRAAPRAARGRAPRRGPRRFDEDRQLLLDALLADEVLELPAAASGRGPPRPG